MVCQPWKKPVEIHTHPMLWQPPKIAQALCPYSHGSSRFSTACRCHDHRDTIGGNGCQDLLRVTAKGRICISWCPFNGSCVGILMDLDDLEALCVFLQEYEAKGY